MQAGTAAVCGLSDEVALDRPRTGRRLLLLPVTRTHRRGSPARTAAALVDRTHADPQGTPAGSAHARTRRQRQRAPPGRIALVRDAMARPLAYGRLADPAPSPPMMLRGDVCRHVRVARCAGCRSCSSGAALHRTSAGAPVFADAATAEVHAQSAQHAACAPARSRAGRQESPSNRPLLGSASTCGQHAEREAQSRASTQSAQLGQKLLPVALPYAACWQRSHREP